MLTANDIQVGKTYRGKRRRAGFDYRTFTDVYDDREVLWISVGRTSVQYDHPFITDGRNYPITTMEKFLKWANTPSTSLKSDLTFPDVTSGEASLYKWISLRAFTLAGTPE